MLITDCLQLVGMMWMIG